MATHGFSEDSARRIAKTVRTVEGLQTRGAAKPRDVIPAGFAALQFVRLTSAVQTASRYPGKWITFDEAATGTTGDDRDDIWVVCARGTTLATGVNYLARFAGYANSRPVYRVSEPVNGSGLTSLNGLTAASQTFAVGTSGTDFAIVSGGTTHTWNLPDASVVARGVVTIGPQTFAGDKSFNGFVTFNSVITQNISTLSVGYATYTGAGHSGYYTGVGEGSIYPGALPNHLEGGVLFSGKYDPAGEILDDEVAVGLLLDSDAGRIVLWSQIGNPDDNVANISSPDFSIRESDGTIYDGATGNGGPGGTYINVKGGIVTAMAWPNQWPLSYGGTGSQLSDPGADKMMFWDDSAGAVDWLTVGSGLTVSGTTITADTTNPTKAIIPGGRLTTQSGSPVSTGSRSAQTLLYYSPYLHNIIALWDGSAWQAKEFSETSISLGSVSTSTNYDVFAYLSGGSPAFELLVWTNDTTRATTITYQDGRLCKNGDKTRLYLGTIRTGTIAFTVEDTFRQRFVWNMYNRAHRQIVVTDVTNSWTYTTAAFRQWNNSATNQAEVIVGRNENPVYLQFGALAYSSVGGSLANGIGLDSASSNSATVFPQGGNHATGDSASLWSIYNDHIAEGYHYLALLEYGNGSGTTTWYGDAGSSAFQSGATGWMMG